jgi:hypothetical protein
LQTSIYSNNSELVTPDAVSEAEDGAGKYINSLTVKVGLAGRGRVVEVVALEVDVEADVAAGAEDDAAFFVDVDVDVEVVVVVVEVVENEGSHMASIRRFGEPPLQREEENLDLSSLKSNGSMRTTDLPCEINGLE